MAGSAPVEFDFAEAAIYEHRSLWQIAWRRLVTNRTALLGMGIVIFFLLATVLAHFFWPYDARTDKDYSVKLKPPTFVPNEEVPSVHPFGTDKLGRDIFRRVVHGGWNSLRVGLVSVGIALGVGGLLGLLAGFYESMPIGRGEKAVLVGLIGFVLGLLPSWLGGQVFYHLGDQVAQAIGPDPGLAGFLPWLQGAAATIARFLVQNLEAVIFCALGVAIVYLLDLFVAGETRRATVPQLLLAGVTGLLLGGVPALWVSPYTAIACAMLGAIIGIVMVLPLEGPLLSNIVMRMMDVVLAFPGILLAIAIVTMLGPGLDRGMIAIGVVNIPVYARLVRSSVLSVIQNNYIEATQALGAGTMRTLFRHVLPNSLSPVIVQSTMGLASAILWAGALGFLGLGAIPPEPEWGAILGDSYRFLASGSWWAVVFPGLAIMLSVLGFNLLGDGLRDALDPRLQV